jgi:hypothetical protein
MDAERDHAKTELEQFKVDISSAIKQRRSVANMASYAISSSMILVIHDNMINGTNHIA